MLLVRQGLLTTDELRRGVEALPGHADMSYYHRFYTIQIYVPGQKTTFKILDNKSIFGNILFGKYDFGRYAFGKYVFGKYAFGKYPFHLLGRSLKLVGGFLNPFLLIIKVGCFHDCNMCGKGNFHLGGVEERGGGGGG